METPYNPLNTLISQDDICKILSTYGVKEKPNNIGLYRCATVHKSYCTRKNENFVDGNVSCPKNCLPLQEESNERLEFLGDSVLGMIVAGYLFERYPDQNEGFLTKVRTKLVNGKTLAKLCKMIGLEKFILISRQIEENNGRNIANILEDAFEAFLAAVYLDFGFNVVRDWLVDFLESNIDFSELIRQNTNYKDQLLKYFQQTQGYLPKFFEIDVECVNNHKIFKVCLKDCNENVISVGTGNSKKEAENDASKTALESLCIEFTQVGKQEV